MHSSRANNRQQQQLAMEARNSRDGNGNGDGKGDALTFDNLPTAGSMLSIATASSSSSSSSSSDSASAAVDIIHQSRLLSAAFSSHGSSNSSVIPELIFNPISLLHLNPPPLPTAITGAAAHLDNSPFISFAKDPGFAERAAKFSCFSTATARSPPPLRPLSQYFPWSSTNNADDDNTTTTSAAEIKAFCRSVDAINPQDLKATFRRVRLREEDEDQDRDGDDNDNNNNNNEDEDEEDEEGAEEAAFITSCTATTKKRSGDIILNGDPDHKYKLDRPSELLTSKGRLRKRKVSCGTAIHPKDLKGFNNELERVGRNSASDNSKENETDDKSGEDAVTSPPLTNYDDSISIDTNTNTNADTNMNTNYTNKSVKSIGALETPKMDYIHVRARRGQATDSHSLAERVRREKISERMKVLQDLVPGCNKAIGKAVMLDEIINYVQSLQQQVEFLSMKLAAVNRNLGGNSHEAFNKEMHREHVARPSVAPSLPFSSKNASPLIQTIVPTPLQSPMAISTSSLRAHRNIIHTVVDSSLLSNGTTRVDATTTISPPPPQVMGQEQAMAWEDELQSVVQMGFGHSAHKLSSRAAAQGG